MASTLARRNTSHVFLPYLLNAGAVALLLGGMAALFYVYRVDELANEYNRAAPVALAQASQFIRNEIDVVSGDALLLASNGSNNSTTGTEAEAKALLQLRPNYRHVIYLDNLGRDILQIDRAGSTTTMSGKQRALPRWPYQARAMALGPGQLYASALIRDMDSEVGRDPGLVIYFATPRFDAHLSRLGAVVIVYDIDSLLGSVRNLKYGPMGHFDLIEGSGNPIDSSQSPHLSTSKYHWSTDIPLTPATAANGNHLTLQYQLADATVAIANRTQMSWAIALWLIALIPAAGLVLLARRARQGEHKMALLFAESQERLLEAEQLARIGYWRWQASDDLLVLSPQAAAMLGRQPGEQHMNRTEASALHVFEDERSFFERINHVMNTGETSAADTRITTLRGDRWLHSIMRPDRDRHNKIVGVFGTLQDITARKKTEDELRKLKAEYMALLDHIPATILYLDLDGRCVMVNETLLQSSGLTRQQWEGRHLRDLFPPQDAERRLRVNSEVIRTETPKFGIIESVTRFNGEVQWLHVDIVPRRDVNERVIGVVVFALDITHLKNVENQLRAATTEREMILNRIPAFVVYKDLDGYVLHANRVAAMYVRKPMEDNETHTGAQFLFPHENPDLMRRMEAEVIRTAQPSLGTLESVTLNDGSTQWFEIDVFPSFDELGKVTGLVLFGIDVSERKRHEQQIAYLAMHDPLTNLCNRRLLADRLAQALTHCKRRESHCALLFVDLDRFKQVNDMHGHEIGDLLLIEVAQRLYSCVRSEDTVARVGGDEFVILLHDTADVSGALVVAEKLRTRLSEPYIIRGLTVEIGSSVGVASYPEHGQTENDLMCAADKAMFEAKVSGRGAVRVATVTSPISPKYGTGWN